MLLEGVIFFAVFFMVFALFLTIVCRDASHFNGIDPIKDMSFGHAFLSRLYFTVTTFSTVGFGDVTPVSVRARIILILTVFFFIVLILQSLENMRSRLMTSLSPVTDKLGLTKKAEDPATPAVPATPATAATPTPTATVVATVPDVTSTPLTTNGGDPDLFYVADGGLTTGNLTYMLPSS